jgi:uncharacterized lipoprotein YajG
MKRRFVAGAILVFLAGVVLLSGCSRRMNLVYTKPPFDVMDRGEICVVVKDERPAKHGGNNPDLIGQVRSGAGIPSGVYAKEDRDPTKVAKEVIVDSLKATGYKVVDQSAGVPGIYASLEEFWGDGYMHYKMSLTIPVELKKGESSSSVWSKTIKSKAGVTLMWGPSELNKGYRDMLEEATRQFRLLFQSPEFQNSYRTIAR